MKGGFPSREMGVEVLCSIRGASPWVHTWPSTPMKREMKGGLLAR